MIDIRLTPPPDNPSTKELAEYLRGFVRDLNMILDSIREEERK